MMWYNIQVAERSRRQWEHSSVGRASALQAEGHRFEPYCSHHFFGPVVQLVRTLACHARGQGFESPSGRQQNTARAVCLCSSVGRAEDWKSSCRWFDSDRRHQCGFSSFGRARPCQGRGGGFDPRNPLQTVVVFSPEQKHTTKYLTKPAFAIPRRK